MYWSYWWLYEPSESTGSKPIIYRTCSFSFFTVYHHVDILGLNELLFSFPPMLELQHEHLGEMKILRERIEGMGLKIEDNQYTSMIQKSLPPSYDYIRRTLSAASKFTGKALTSDILVAALHEEWDEEIALKPTAENVAMSAQWQIKGKGQSSGGKSKKRPDRSHLKCTNPVCGKNRSSHCRLLVRGWWKGGSRPGIEKEQG